MFKSPERNAAIDAEIARRSAMSPDEVRAELERDGIDPKEAVEAVRKLIRETVDNALQNDDK